MTFTILLLLLQSNLPKILKHNFRDLRNAGIGKKPYILVAYSMGGIVTRHMILTQLKAKNDEN